MSFIKNVSGPYTINTINHDDPITMDSNQVIIKGNLTVIGNSTSVTSNNTSINDTVITLNAGWSGRVPPQPNPYPGPSGIEIDRGQGDNLTYPNVYIRWNEVANANATIQNTLSSWQIVTPAFPSGMNIVATTTGNTRVVDDVAPQLGGNLFTNGYAITNATGNIFLDPATTVSLNGNLSLQMAGNVWGNVQAYNTLIADQVGAGGTGLYVTTGDGGVTSQELITKRRAIVYSIVF